MKAIILAAGYGKRMRPLTYSVHNTLLRDGTMTILERIVNSLLAHDICDIVVVTGYRSEEITQFLRDHYGQAKFTFVHNPRFAETNNIFSLSLVFNTLSIDSDVLLIESDLVFDDCVLTRILGSRFENVALVDRFRSGMDGTVVTVTDNVITSIIPPHLQNEQFDFSDKFKTLNIYKFSVEFCRTAFRQLLTYYAKVIDDNCYYEQILGILIYMQREIIHAEILDEEEWSEVDDPNDLRVSRFVFEKNERARLLAETFGGFWSHDILDFSFIRNMYFPTSAMLSELKAGIADLVRNYGSRQQVLDEKLAFLLLCDPGRVVLLNGASQVFPLLRERFSDHSILIPEPTFGEFPRAFPHAAAYPDRVGIDPADIEARAAGVDAVVLVNPNNPTGSLVECEWIHDFARRNPRHRIIVDESFIDFSGCRSVMALLEEAPLDNVIVVKSLSKALGVPGLRLGFVYSCNPEVIHHIRGTLPIWNTNSIAEFFLEIILKHREALARSFELTARDKEELVADLGELPGIATVFPSAANFVLVRIAGLGRVPRLIHELLAHDSIYVKDVSDRFVGDDLMLRVAVRLPEENRLLLRRLGERLAGSGR